MIAGDTVFFNSAQAAKFLDISIGHLHAEKAAGRIRYEQRARGCRVRYRLEHLEAYAAGVDPLADELASRRKRGASA